MEPTMRTTALLLALTCALTAVADAPPAATWQSTFAVDKSTLADRGRNPYVVLIPGHRLTLAGADATVLITVLDQTQVVDGVRCRVVEERETEGGTLKEISRNYLAIHPVTKDVYYFGEDVDIYKDGKVVAHAGAWRSGVAGARFGLLMPGKPTVGQRHYQELAPKVAMDRAEVVSLTGSLKTPLNPYERVLVVMETSALERGASRKWYAVGVGMIGDDALRLVKLEPAKADAPARADPPPRKEPPPPKGPPAAPAAPPTPAQVRRWAAELTGKDAAQAAAARRSLLEAGPAVLPTLYGRVTRARGAARATLLRVYTHLRRVQIASWVDDLDGADAARAAAARHSLFAGQREVQQQLATLQAQARGARRDRLGALLSRIRTGRVRASLERTRQRVRWAHALDGPGAATPVRVGGLLLLQTRGGTLTALDLQTGARRWQRAGIGPKTPRPRARSLFAQTAADLAVVGRTVYVDLAGQLAVLEPATGTTRALGADTPPVVGTLQAAGETLLELRPRTLIRRAVDGRIAWRLDDVARALPPVAHADSIVVARTDGRVEAYDAASGALRWRSLRLGSASWMCSVGPELAVQTGEALAVLDPRRTGKLCWRAPQLPSAWSHLAPPSPLVDGRRLFMISPTGPLAVDLATRKVLWRPEHRRAGFAPATLVRRGPHLLSASRGSITALSVETGAQVWHALLAGESVREQALVADPLLIVVCESSTVRGLPSLVCAIGPQTDTERGR